MPALWLLGCVLVGSGCQPELPLPGPPATGRELVKASVRHHDPTGRWPAFAAEVGIASRLAGGGAYRNEVLIDRVRDTFRRRAIDLAGRYDLVQWVGPAGCGADWTDPAATDAQRERVGLGTDPCRYIAWRRAFYEFLVGLPMSALEGAPVFAAAGTRDTVAGEAVWAVQVDFPAGDGNTWWLYLRGDDYQLVAARFASAPDGSDGEWLLYDRWVAYDGLLLRGRQAWYAGGVRPGGLLVTDELTYQAL